MQQESDSPGRGYVLPRTAHTVAVLALDDLIPFDLATPIEVFRWVRLADGSPGYRVVVAAERRRVAADLLDLAAPHGLEALATADTIVVPGRNDAFAPVSPTVVEALRAAAAGGARIVSICVGAVVLASAGLLDGRAATTHWRIADEFARRFPLVRLDPMVLHVDVDADPVFTSAGAAAGLDLCLHLVQRDHGAAVAADAARTAVMPLTREGGQAQFIRRPVPVETGSLAPVLDWIEEHCEQPLTVPDIATRARLSVRTVNRRFRQELGETPLAVLHRARLRRAQVLLETSALPVDAVAAASGFGSGANLRTVFRARVGTTPAAYRAAFRG